MKQQIISEVMQQMLPHLDNAQMQQLQKVLENTLFGCEITAQKEKKDTNDNPKLIDAFVSAKRIEGCSEKTLKYYRTTIETMVASINKGIRHIQTEDLRSYLTDYQSRNQSSRVTIDNIRRILSSFFSWLEDEDYILKSPVRRIHKVKTATNIKETYTDEDLEKMRDSCTELRDLAIIDMLASTGMRIGEMVLLNKVDINFNERECVVFGKGDKERIVYFDARTKIHLQNYIDSRMDDNPALFVTLCSPHERIKIGGIESRLREMGKQLDIQKVHPHQRVCKLVPKEGLNAKYIYYYFRVFDNFYALASIAKGSASQANISTKDIEAMEIALPSLNIQNKIVSVLDSIEEKINQNNKINKNLEQQAKAIFSNEFLTLETLPDGWKQASLIDIADYLNGLAMQKHRPTADETGIPVLKIKELRQGCCDNNSELCSPSIKSEYIIHDGDVIFSWSGSLLVDFWCGGICGLNQHLFKVTSNKYNKWFYYAWTKHHLDRFIAVAADKATTMGHIKRDELSKAEVLIPNEADYKRIETLLQPIYDLIIANRIENKKLAETRDTLLPKLMTGEIDISEVDYE